MVLFRKFLRVVCWVSFIIIVVSFFMRDRLPERDLILSELNREPIQEETTQGPFVVKQDGVEYTISPLYTYDIVGLVVSEHTTDSWFDYYHKKWGDTLNSKDVCVVWGENAVSGVYKDISFKSGSWTCWYKTKNRDAWQTFSVEQVSNNHLLTSSQDVRNALNHVRRGDQIRIKGYLASYSHSGGFERGTSVTRNDTGNGACETIYISEIEILRKANQTWDNLYNFAIGLLLISLLMRFILSFTRTKKPKKSKAKAESYRIYDSK